MKYKYWLDEWLNDIVKPTASVATYRRYSCIAKRQLLPELGELELSEVTRPTLQRFALGLSRAGNCRTGGGLAPNSVGMAVSVAQASLRAAKEMNVYGACAIDGIKRPQAGNPRFNCFTIDEQRKIERAALDCGKKKMIGLAVGLYTGLRLGELLALEWTDVDFRRGVLTVNKSCGYIKNRDNRYERVVKSPKTSCSCRVIPLSKQVTTLLKKLQKGGVGKYVISNGGKPINPRSYQRSFERLLKRLGIGHRGFHALRHTFATRSLECGMDVKTLSELLGHKNPTVTLNRYAHSFMEYKREMMNKVGRLLDTPK